MSMKKREETAESTNENRSELAESRSLKFIDRNPLLKQVFKREPNDNYYPEIKAASDYWTLSEL